MKEGCNCSDFHSLNSFYHLLRMTLEAHAFCSSPSTRHGDLDADLSRKLQRLHFAFIYVESMAGMCATIHYIIEADELFVQTLQSTYLHLDFGTVLNTIGLLMHIYLRIYLLFTRWG